MHLPTFSSLLATAILTHATTATAQDTNGGFLCPTAGTAFASYAACADNQAYSATFTECFTPTVGALSTPTDYNWASCSCTQYEVQSSCMAEWCPAQATADLSPWISYYCALATGGTPAAPGAATASAEVTASATLDANAGAPTVTSGDPPTGTDKASLGSPSDATKPGSGVMVEPVSSIGMGTAVLFGLLAVIL